MVALIFFLTLPLGFTTETAWRLIQLTECSGGWAINPQISDDGRTIIFLSNCDLANFNYDKTPELYRYRLGQMTQLTFRSECAVHEAGMDASGRIIAFVSTCDYTGQNPDKNPEIFLLQEEKPIQQITKTITYPNDQISLDPGGQYIAFRSAADINGQNLDHSRQIFIADIRGPETEIKTVAETRPEVEQNTPSISGGVVAFQSDMDLNEGNKDKNMEIFAATVGGKVVQLTHSERCLNQSPVINRAGNAVLFQSSCDLVGENPNHYHELFQAKGMDTIRQITRGVGEGCWDARLNPAGNLAIFTSRHGSGHENSDHTLDVFRIPVEQEEIITKPELIYDLKMGGASAPVMDREGTTVIFSSNANPLGRNPDGTSEIFMATQRLDRQEQEPSEISPGESPEESPMESPKEAEEKESENP